MPGSQTWFEWLSGLFSPQPDPPAPGSHEAELEAWRVSALASKECRKPQGERDAELVRTLNLEYCKRQLENNKALVDRYARSVAIFEQPASRECCIALGWVRQRSAAAYRAVQDYHCQWRLQLLEEQAAAEARRPAVIAAQPTLRLHLPEALQQQQPPRLDMCSSCARWIEQLENVEESCRLHAGVMQEQFKRRGMQPAPAVATAASQGATLAAAAAAALPAEVEAQQRQGQPPVQRQCGGDSNAGVADGSPATPKQAPVPPQQQQQQQQQQHSSSYQEQEPEQQQEWDAAHELRLLLQESQQQQQQILEEQAAAEARRPAMIAAQPTLRLHLPEALQQQPPRLDMCSTCARWIEQLEMVEASCPGHARVVQEQFKRRGMQPVPAVATAASQGAALAAAAAAALPAEGEAQQRQGQPPVQRQCGGDSNTGVADGSPATPKQAPVPPQQQQQQQHSSSYQEQEPPQQQEWDAEDERRLLLPES